MNYTEAINKLERYSQQHILKYYEELKAEEKELLLQQIDKTDFGILEQARTVTSTNKGEITPLGAMELSEIDRRKDEFMQKGISALKEGKVAALLLAGGMGTRLGSKDPKGMYNVGLTKDLYIFECLINNLMDVVKSCGQMIHLFIMTSEKNNEATVGFLKEKSYFGYPEEYVHFFQQEMAPATDYEGNVYMESKGRIATSPNGNGGWFSSLKKAGLDKLIENEGIEWMNLFAVDNVLQRIADPVFVGATLESGMAVGAKVVRKKNPDEAVGVMCLEDGKPSIVEYYELNDEMKSAKNEKGDPAYNFGVILNYLFRVRDLNELADAGLPLHIVKKKIACLDNEGRLVEPSEPNGYKYENLVLDMIHMLSGCLPFEVIREKEFAPIKNLTGVDSVDSARTLLKENGVVL